VISTKLKEFKKFLSKNPEEVTQETAVTQKLIKENNN